MSEIKIEEIMSSFVDSGFSKLTKRINLEQSKEGFVVKVYSHLLLAIFTVVALEILLFQNGIAQNIAQYLMGIPWLAILGAFMIVAWLARKIAYKAQSLTLQYVGLLGYVLAETFILIPLLYQTERIAPGAIENAAQFTAFGFAGLTAIVMITKKDFSFLRSLLMWGGFIALGLILIAVIFKFSLGIWFDVAMIALGGGSVLYDTSSILQRYPKHKYVSASLSLFASVAMIFWYALRMFRRVSR